MVICPYYVACDWSISYQTGQSCLGWMTSLRLFYGYDVYGNDDDHDDDDDRYDDDDDDDEEVSPVSMIWKVNSLLFMSSQPTCMSSLCKTTKHHRRRRRRRRHRHRYPFDVIKTVGHAPKEDQNQWDPHKTDGSNAFIQGNECPPSLSLSPLSLSSFLLMRPSPRSWSCPPPVVCCVSCEVLLVLLYLLSIIKLTNN